MRNTIIGSLLFFTFFLSGIFCMAQATKEWNKTNDKGQKIGNWRDYYENGNLRYEGQFKEDQPFDVFRYYFPDGKLKSVLKYDPNKKGVAEAVHYYQTGDKMAEGNYLDRKKSGVWKTYGSNEVLVDEGSYISGKKFGKWMVYYANGQVLSEVYMERDLEKGIKKEYYPTGELKKEVNYVEGIRKGPTVIYSIEGDTLVKGNFLKDVRHGKWYFYKKDNQLDKILEFEEGELLNEDDLEDPFSNPGEDRKKRKDRLEFRDMNGTIHYEQER